jgi:hypothetical protein
MCTLHQILLGWSYQEGLERPRCWWCKENIKMSCKEMMFEGTGSLFWLKIGFSRSYEHGNEHSRSLKDGEL